MRPSCARRSREPQSTRAAQASVEALEELEVTADAVTDRVEHANRLFKAAAEDRLLDPGLVTGEIGALLGLLDRLDREKRYAEEIRVAKALHGLCVLAFRWRDLVRSLRSTLRAAQAVGDESGQAWALNELGALHLCAGAPKQAAECLERALELQERLGDVAGRCATRHNLDNATRDATRPVQIGASRRLVAVGAVLGALALFGGGGAALGFVVGDARGDPSPSGSTETLAQTAVLTVELDGGGSGAVVGQGIDCGDDCEEELAEGASLTLTAEADEGSVFARWNRRLLRRGPACADLHADRRRRRHRGRRLPEAGSGLTAPHRGDRRRRRRHGFRRRHRLRRRLRRGLRDRHDGDPRGRGG